MKIEDLEKALQYFVIAVPENSVQTGSLVCLGCGYEHNCGIKGCALIRAAVEQLEVKKLNE